MSRGLGKLQRTILGLLRGTERGEVYRNSGSLTTRELVEELRTREMLNDAKPEKQHLAAVRRACDGLARQGLLGGVYHRDDPFVGAYMITWTATAKAQEV
jgi:hypothetical protein